MAIVGIDHVVMRVKDLDAGIANYEKLGMKLEKTLETEGIGKQAIFRFDDGTFIELVQPTDPASPASRSAVCTCPAIWCSPMTMESSPQVTRMACLTAASPSYT